MKKIRTLWCRFRAWHLNRWADALLKDAEQHREAAKLHSSAASLYWMKSSDVRSLARRLQAAGL
jgi:hypothetical protein